MRRGFLLLAALLGLALAGPAQAGGFDTPILYSARHMGMGGTAIGYVYDPSALFHNPAGLGHTKRFSLTADFTPLMGSIVSSPESYETATNIESNTVFAPFFLVGGSVRVTDWLTLGIGAYPVASAAASYNYVNKAGKDYEDLTKLVFIEVAPGVAVDLPWNLRLGASYRATMITFDRVKGDVGAEPSKRLLDIHLKGFNWAGFKVGLQWQPIPWLQAGIVYRHKTETEVSADNSSIFTIAAGHTTMDFTLPSKLGVGVRADLGPLGAAVDAEYGFNSQNQKSTIVAETGAAPLTIASQFRWQDSLTLRGGLEFSALPKLLKLRTGYVFDGQVSNKTYPSAFGTPPGPTHSITGGVGTDLTLGGMGLEVNLGYAYRFGGATITQADIDARPKTADGKADAEYVCNACAYPGDYEIGLHGLYVDASLYF